MLTGLETKTKSVIEIEDINTKKKKNGQRNINLRITSILLQT